MASSGTWRLEAPRLQEQDLAGKIAVVTGATRGIGRAIALDLATRGASVLGTYSSISSAHHFDTLSHTVSALYKPASHSASAPRMVGVTANILSPDCATAITNALGEHFRGKVDIVVFNAAVLEVSKVGEIAEDHVQRMLFGNIQTPVMVIEALVRKGMFQPNSRIVTISSDGARRPRPGGSIYSATKSALESLTRCWADELGKRSGMVGTTVNAVCVGLTKSDAYNKIPEERKQAITEADAKAVGVGDRIAECEDIADVVGLLVSEKARWVTGSVMCATGGAIKVL